MSLSRGLQPPVSAELQRSPGAASAGKKAFALWSTKPNPDGFQFADVSSAAAEITELRPLLQHYSGAASIASYTVKYESAQPSTLIAICDTADGKRAIATSKDARLASKATEQEFCGRKVTIDKIATLRLT